MESLIEKYEQLFSIKILHNWFADNVCSFISIEPDITTKKLMKKMHLIDKKYDGEITVAAKIVETKKDNKTVQIPAYTFGKNEHLIFLLKINNPEFFNITNLDFSGFPKQVLCYSSNTQTNKLTAEKCFVTDSTAVVNFSKGKSPLKEIVTNGKKEIYNEPVKKNETFFEYNFSGAETGLYNIESEFAKADKALDQTQAFYYNPLIKTQAVIGIVNINVSAIDTINDDNNIFIIEFKKHKH